jgi:hypothetical protein
MDSCCNVAIFDYVRKELQEVGRGGDIRGTPSALMKA